MILFLVKGLLRDRTRSLFPTLVVTAGVMLTVVLYSYIKGSENDIVRTAASFRVTTRRVGRHPFTSIDVQRAAGAALVAVTAQWFLPIDTDVLPPSAQLAASAPNPAAPARCA